MIEAKKSKLISSIIICIILTSFAVTCIIPIIAVLSISLSNEMDILRHGYSLIPREISLTAYQYIFKVPKHILQSYFISTSVTGAGTLLSLFIIALLAYPLSRRDFKYRNALAFYIFFTMLFNGGLVPWYILIVRYLHLKDTWWVLVLPYLVLPWFVLLLKTFFQQIPISIIESAKLDGASELRIFFTIIVPLSKPALAAIGLFILLRYWNDWWLPLLYIDSENLVPLQYMLQRMMANIQFLTQQLRTTQMFIDVSKLPNESARMAMCILAAGPMLFIFPFFQKYFVKGLTVGAIKG
ncbi:MAG: ABC transporter permease subunit [Clostridia bacterium]|jgi:putative aldouronate transport system permease protein|nr:ABC transporter permease subunit [Clostridia bacterium]